ncbi:hypothetical protein LSH36_577g03026 [Paralvinella palmiformis]|uniref:Complex 1 LYR protein domain-containing protein n=1 Tax=Paralvinella palmiformis TaxID=53620 RepID=A0AAD9MVH2_9ANNE|nr:hypothetical protein LSH36_577g03026 [Paralvinella palmiformis]
MMSCSRQAVLSLYRQLLTKSRSLLYTDKDYYLTRIRKEFRNNQHLTDKKEIEFLLEKGAAFLQKNRLL